jgi:predicted subunit of tRNA(5-methylaminomethyl-2-thiouridylate) methyltransferase
MNVVDAKARRLLDPSIESLFRQAARAPLTSVLMFSGGRDSSVAALRMYETGNTPILVTISSWHLKGMDRVRERVNEIKRQMPADIPWLIIRQPVELRTDTSFYEQTCLPCHHAYVVAGAFVAAKAGIKTLAFGYACYQNGWPEQTLLAVERLATVLDRHGIELALPVYDLASREQVLDELTARGLSSASLEQKCIQQVRNVKLDQVNLVQQIDMWERAIDVSISRLSEIDIEVVEANLIGSC